MMSPAPVPGLRDRLLTLGWRIALACLPVTSLVLLTQEPGGLRPITTCLILVLAPLALLTWWRSALADRPIRFLVIASLAFVAVGAAILALDPPGAISGKPGPASLFIKGAFSLGAGCVVYLFARERLRGRAEVLAAVPWIVSGITATVILATLQAVSLYPTFSPLRSWTVGISSWFSSVYATTPTPHMGRGHGLAYEPSYVASLLLVVGLPLGIWLLVEGTRWRSGFALVALSSLGLAAAGSRLGLVAGGGVLLVAALGIAMVPAYRRAFLPFCAAVALGAGCGAPLVTGNPYVVFDKRVIFGDAPLISDDTSQPPVLVRATHTAPRVAAAIASWRIWCEHPLRGAGLGLSPLEIPQHVPLWALQWPEVRRAVTIGDPALLTPMSMAFRLLAEGGMLALLAAILFMAFHRPESKKLDDCWLLFGLGGMVLVADSLFMASFVLPYSWILLAMCRAVGRHD